MAKSYVWVMLTFGCLAAGSLALHAYMGRSESPSAIRLRSAYLHTDPVNGHDHVAACVDSVIPAVVMGVVIGVLGRRWSASVLILSVLLASGGIIAQFPAYASWIPKGRSPWWPDTFPEDYISVGRYFVVSYFKTLFTCGGVVFFARMLGLDRSSWKRVGNRDRQDRGIERGVRITGLCADQSS